MVRRLLLYSVLVAAVAGFLLMRRGIHSAPDAVPAAMKAAAPTVSVAALAADRARAASHLLPDARFLDAIGEVAHIVTGTPFKRASAVFSGNGWTIRLGEREVGRLAEFPHYMEACRLLTAWACGLGAAESLATGAGGGAGRARAAAAIDGELAALHALRAADLADRAWAAGHRDAATARRGARALVWMAAECFDEAGAGEIIAARALAWSAVARAADSSALGSERALLAEVMGYPAEAVAQAAGLAEMDPVRYYVLRRDESLNAVASRGPGPAAGGWGREARWLALRRSVERRDIEAWTVAAERGLDSDTLLTLPLFSSRLALGRFETATRAGGALLLAVAADLRLNDVVPAPIAALDDRPLGAVMEMFETLLDAMPESADGAFLDRELLRGWYRAAFYSSLMSIGEHLREELSDLHATQAFAKSMGDGGKAEGPAAEFQGWYSHLASLKADAALHADLKQDLIGMSHFGGGPRLKTWNAMRECTYSADPFVRHCARYLERRLDTRPEHLDAWGWIVMADLFDIVRGEELLAESVRASDPHDLGRRGWWAAYRDDRATLDALLRDSAFRPEERVALIHSLRAMTPADSLRLDALSEQLVADRPDDWAIVGPYVRALAERHRSVRVRELSSAWLARTGRSQRAFDDIDARNRLAAACLAEGRIDEGYDAIGPAVASWQGTAMSLGAEFLDRRGRGAAAETLAMLSWRRYVDNDESQALMVDLLWRHGKFDEAARMLAAAPVPLTLNGWRHALGPRFVRFEREHPAEAKQAIDAMAALKLDDWPRLGGLILALAGAGRNAEAARLVARVRQDDGVNRELVISTYGYVKGALGARAAADWLLSHLPGKDSNTLGYLHFYAYAHHLGEVQWLLPDPTGSEGVVENLWLMRVATAVRDTVGTPEQLARLKMYFARPGPNRYRHFARLLLGLEPADSVLALALDNRGEGEAYYYIALGLQARGDVREAARWYSRCLDVNVRSNGEHSWAMQQLAAWVARDRSIERIAAEGRRTPATAKASGPAI